LELLVVLFFIFSKVLEMKRFNFILLVFKGLFNNKKLWLLISLYCLFISYFLQKIAREGYQADRGLFDVIVDIYGTNGSANFNMLLFIGIPVIVTVLSLVVENNERASFVLKYGSRYHTWHAHVLSAIFLSLILTCYILIVSLLMAGMLVGWENTWLKASGTIGTFLNDQMQFSSIIPNLATNKIIITIFVTKLLVFFMISFTYLFLRQFIKNSAVIMIIIMAISGFDYTGVLHFPIYTWTATLTLQNWIDPILTIYRSIYLIIISTVLYAFTGWLYERKDFLS